jgi:hypothetical protein
MYIMLDALKYPFPNSNKKFELINNQANQYNVPIFGIDVQPPEAFHRSNVWNASGGCTSIPNIGTLY